MTDVRCSRTPPEVLQHIYGRAGSVAKDQAKLRDFEHGELAWTKIRVYEAEERRRCLATLALFRLLDLCFLRAMEGEP